MKYDKSTIPASRNSKGHGCQRDSLDLQVAHHAEGSAAHFADHVRSRDLLIQKIQGIIVKNTKGIIGKIKIFIQVWIDTLQLHIRIEDYDHNNLL